MSTTEIIKLKKVLIKILKEWRGLTFLSSDELKIENFKKYDDKYEFSGKYEYTTLFGLTIESGEFKIILDKNLKPISVNIKPTEKH
ncbi:MAG: hypothetical protein NDF54_08455 [archaeon GB-1867-035]|nr:hypothetical protein [Candidatus Culexmicrobium profundum]